MTFDYFTPNQSDQYQFIRIPKVMISDPMFASLSIAAKMLYGFLLNLTGISAANGWVDGKNRVYVIFEVSQMQTILCCSKKKAILVSDELVDFGLIYKQRMGGNLPNRIYVKNFLSRRDSRDDSDEEDHEDSCTACDSVLSFDYLYAKEIDKFQYIKIPKLMLSDPSFQPLSVHAKMLYGSFLSLTSLSAVNQWIDAKNRIYVVCRIHYIRDQLNCSEKKAASVVNELAGFGLVEKDHKSGCRANRYYVKNFLTHHKKKKQEQAVDSDTSTQNLHDTGSVKNAVNDLPDPAPSSEAIYTATVTYDSVSYDVEASFCPFTAEYDPIEAADRVDLADFECDKQHQNAPKSAQMEVSNLPSTAANADMEVSESTPVEVSKRQVEVSKTTPVEVSKRRMEVSKTTPVEVSKRRMEVSKTTVVKSKKKKRTSVSKNQSNQILSELNGQLHSAEMELLEIRDRIERNIDFEFLYKNYPDDIETIHGLTDLILEVLSCKGRSMRIAGYEQNLSLVQRQFESLTSDHLAYVLDNMKRNTNPIGNIKNYLLASLFNSVSTMNPYYDSLVRYELGNRR